MSKRRDTPVVFESLVADATMAASSHNTQPWRFEIGENLIRGPRVSADCPRSSLMSRLLMAAEQGLCLRNAS